MNYTLTILILTLASVVYGQNENDSESDFSDGLGNLKLEYEILDSMQSNPANLNFMYQILSHVLQGMIRKMVTVTD